MSKFDLEAAKRGEVVQVCSAKGEWQDIKFVGMAGGYAVLGDPDDLQFFALNDHRIRMKPKPKREMWIFPYSSDGVIFTSTPCETRSEAEIVRLNFPRPAGEVQMILVEE